jgi:hypothetical protein
VEQRSSSTSGGAAARQTMQTPSPSQGRSGMAARGCGGWGERGRGRGWCALGFGSGRRRGGM